MAPDPLSDVLRTLRLTGAVFFLWDVSWPYRTPVPAGRAIAPIILPGAQQIVSYHIVTQGTCWGGLVGGQPVRLAAGDILLIPHGDPYVIASSARLCAGADVEVEPTLGFFRQMAAGELPFVVAEGGGGDTSTHLVCGFLGCDMRPFNPALAALPPLVHLRPPAEPSQDRLQSLIDYTLAEARQPRAGGLCVLVRLAELMFIEVVRRCLTEPPAAQGGWLAGLRDPVVGRALRLLHRRPTAAWTLETLAGEVGVSRSRLAECFTRVVGQPPMLYLTRWRLQLAARMLADGAGKVAAVAREVGYESEAAFSRAFKRFAGVPPVQWRREAARAASARPTSETRS
jgi:AraC-like DNA-binding protein